MINWLRGLPRTTQITIALGAAAVAVVGASYLFGENGFLENYRKPKLNVQNIEAKVKAEEQKEYELVEGTAFPAKVQYKNKTALIINQIFSEATSAYRSELNKRGMKELSKEHKNQIIYSIEDTVGFPDTVGEITEIEGRNFYSSIIEIKKTSATREDALEKIRNLIPLEFPPIEQEKTAETGYDNPKEYGPKEGPQGRPSTSLANKETWERMFPRR